MSGIDEQCVVPICPMCKKIPDFWVLYADASGNAKNGWFWLNSDDYLKRYPSDIRITCMPSRSGVIPILDDVMCVCHSTGKQLHKFTSEDLTFQEVLCAARRFENERSR